MPPHEVSTPRDKRDRDSLGGSALKLPKGRCSSRRLQACFGKCKRRRGVVNCGFASLRRSPERLQNGAGNASKWARRGQEPFGGSRRAFREAPRRFRGRKNIVRQVSGAEKSSPRGIFERCSRPEDEISAQKVPQEDPKKPSRGPPKCAKFRKAENAKFADGSMDFEVFVLPEGARTGP